MPDETDARSIITTSPSENWRRHQDVLVLHGWRLSSKTWGLTISSLDEAITVAQNRPLWRLMSAFGDTHP